VKLSFLQRFSNDNFTKKRKKRERWKKGKKRTRNPICFQLSHSFSWAQQPNIFSTLCFW